MSINIQGTSVSEGQLIKFQTHNNYDTKVWQGHVRGSGNFQIASLVTDVYRYYNEMIKDNTASEITTPEDAHFIIIGIVDEDVSVTRNVAFATDWINLDTLEIIGANNNLEIKVFDVPLNKENDLLQLIAEAGFRVRKM